MKEYEFNPNNIEHCLERADALKALEERKLTQVMQPHIGVWNDRRDDEQFDDFQKQFRYRRKPTPVARRWNKRSDVPMPLCWIKENGVDWLVVSVGDMGIVHAHGSLLQWKDIRDDTLHSTDGVNFNPCTTLEP